jgi:hypothetical protein
MDCLTIALKAMDSKILLIMCMMGFVTVELSQAYAEH